MADSDPIWMTNPAVPGATAQVATTAVAYWQTKGWTVASVPAQPAFAGYEALAPIVDAKGDILAASGNDTVGRVPVGSDGRYLVADSTQPLGVRWSTQPESTIVRPTLVDAKGDLLVGTADDTLARKAVGAIGTLLGADPNDAAGLSWKAQPEILRNLITNPTAAVDVSTLTGSTLITRSTAWRAGGAIRLTVPASPPNTDTYASLGGDTGTFRLGMQAGKTYTLSGRIKNDGTSGADPLARSLVLYYRAAGSSNYLPAKSREVMRTGGEVRASLTVTIPADATEAFVRLYNGSNSPGSWVEFAELILTETAGPVDYFDGDSPGAAWLGTPGLSASILVAARAADVKPRRPAAVNLVADPYPLAYRGPGAVGFESDTYVIAQSRWFGGGGGLGAYSIQTDAANPTTTPVGVNFARKTWTAASNGGGDTGFDIVSANGPVLLAVGDVVRIAGWMRSNRSFIASSSIYLVDGTRGAGVGGANAPTVPANVWTYVEFTMVATTAGYFLQAPMDVSSLVGAPGWAIGDTIDLNGASLTINGAQVRKLYGGDQPGARWRGLPFQSRVELMDPRQQELERLPLSGAGSPEGVIPAEIGTKYVDRTAFAGAVEWIKASGTGATGWKVVYGDTGWRNIASLLGNGCTITGVSSGFVNMRRTGSRCQVQFRAQFAGASGSSNPFLTSIPAGFSGVYECEGAAFNPSDNSGRLVYGGTTNLNVNNAGVGVTLNGSLSWETEQTWPTTLPGTPA